MRIIMPPPKSKDILKKPKGIQDPKTETVKGSLDKKMKMPKLTPKIFKSSDTPDMKKTMGNLTSTFKGELSKLSMAILKALS